MGQTSQRLPDAAYCRISSMVFMIDFRQSFVKPDGFVCQEQIELSGFVVHELSAFSVHQEKASENRGSRIFTISRTTERGV
jgi:hypothetical protein